MKQHRQNVKTYRQSSVWSGFKTQNRKSVVEFSQTLLGPILYFVLKLIFLNSQLVYLCCFRLSISHDVKSNNITIKESRSNLVICKSQLPTTSQLSDRVDGLVDNRIAAGVNNQVTSITCIISSNYWVVNHGKQIKKFYMLGVVNLVVNPADPLPDSVARLRTTRPVW